MAQGIALGWATGLSLLLVACSPAQEAQAPAAARSVAEVPVGSGLAPASGPSEPVVGQKIGESAPPAQPAPASSAPKEAVQASVREPVRVNGYLEIAWEDLLPEGEEERLAAMYQEQMMLLYSGGSIAEGSPQDIATQIGTFNAVPELDGETVRLPGYTVPFDVGADAKVSEFLLVPYFGACIHAPPPPPNQTLLIRAKTPIALRDLPQAVWIEGTLQVEIAETDLADAAYVIEADQVTAYEY
jgi:hypothetical protein